MSLIGRLIRRLDARRALAAAPLTLAVLGVAISASSAPRPETDRLAETVARKTGGDLTDQGLARLTSGWDAAALQLARRHDPRDPKATPLGLTPGWETLSLGGKPTADLGVSGIDAQKLNAASPFETGALRAVKPFAFTAATAEDRRRALRCLTQAVYYEAALEPTEGQEAVAQVVLNRVRDPNYPSSVCGVVFQGAERVTGCQFSFTCDGSLAQGPAAWAWRRAEAVAAKALNGHVARSVGTATHYHANYVHPWWAPTLTKLNQLGAHIFYRWKGLAGESASFSQAYSGKEPWIDEKRFARPRLIVAATPAETQALMEAAVQNGESLLRTVTIDGQTRVVGVASLGGRRPATAQDIASINERLRAFETEAPKPAAAGVVTMEVEEVGRPAPKAAPAASEGSGGES